MLKLLAVSGKAKNTTILKVFGLGDKGWMMVYIGIQGQVLVVLSNTSGFGYSMNEYKHWFFFFLINKCFLKKNNSEFWAWFSQSRTE